MNSPPSTIPLDRPVIGADLQTLQTRLGRSALDCCALLGIPMKDWAEWKGNQDKPIPNHSAALLIRLYDRFPELAPSEPNPVELRTMLEQVTGRRVPLAELSVLLGREKTAGHRWQARGTPTVSVSRLIGALMRLLEAQHLVGFVEYRKLMEQEAAARGISDIMRAGAWKLPEQD